MILLNTKRIDPLKFRSRAFKRLALSASKTLVDAKLGVALHGLRKLGMHSLITRINSAPLQYPSMAAATREYLNGVFREEIAELEKMLNRDVSHWRGQF